MGVLRSVVGRSVRTAGRALEKAVFGNLDDDDEKKKPAPPPDPFAKLKAAEAARKKPR